MTLTWHKFLAGDAGEAAVRQVLSHKGDINVAAALAREAAHHGHIYLSRTKRIRFSEEEPRPV